MERLAASVGDWFHSQRKPSSTVKFGRHLKLSMANRPRAVSKTRAGRFPVVMVKALGCALMNVVTLAKPSVPGLEVKLLPLKRRTSPPNL